MKSVEHSNKKDYGNGIKTYTVEATWIEEYGWGNRYITIAKEHPFYRLIQEKKSIFFNLKTNFSYEWMNENYPIDEQEWTYSEKNEDGGYTFGFDSMHTWNNMQNSSEKMVVKKINDFAEELILQFPY